MLNFIVNNGIVSVFHKTLFLKRLIFEFHEASRVFSSLR